MERPLTKGAERSALRSTRYVISARERDTLLGYARTTQTQPVPRPTNLTIQLYHHYLPTRQYHSHSEPRLKTKTRIFTGPGAEATKHESKKKSPAAQTESPGQASARDSRRQSLCHVAIQQRVRDQGTNPQLSAHGMGRTGLCATAPCTFPLHHSRSDDDGSGSQETWCDLAWK